MGKAKYCLYKHTNLTNKKVYIGITSKKPEYRWCNGKNYSSNEHFYSAIKKYGWNGFSHEIIANNLSEEEAKLMEVKLISEHNSTNPNFGYNISPGGDLQSNVLKKKVFVYDLDGNFVKECESITEAKELFNINHVNLCCSGKLNRVGSYQVSFEKKEFLPPYVTNIKRINFYDLNGQYLFTKQSLREASRDTGVHVFNLKMCLKEDRNHLRAGDYIVRYNSDEFPENKNLDFTFDNLKDKYRVPRKEPVRTVKFKHSKEIIQFSKSGEFILEWETAYKAETTLHIKHINDAANGLRKTAGGFIWKWKNS